MVALVAADVEEAAMEEEADFLASQVVLTAPGAGGVTYADLEREARVSAAGLIARGL